MKTIKVTKTFNIPFNEIERKYRSYVAKVEIINENLKKGFYKGILEKQPILSFDEWWKEKEKEDILKYYLSDIALNYDWDKLNYKVFSKSKGE